MKLLLHTFFFFLLTTQICFGQDRNIDRDISHAVTEEKVNTDSTILIKRIDHIAAYYNSIAEVDSMLSLFNGILGLPMVVSPAIRDIVSPSDNFYNTAVYLGNVYLEFITFNTDTLNPPPPTYIPYFNAFAFTNKITNTNTAAILDSRGIPRTQVFNYLSREPDGTIITPFSTITLTNFDNNDLLVFFCEYYPVAFNCQSLDWCGLPAITDPDSIHIYFGNVLDSLNGGPLTVRKVKNTILTSNYFKTYRQRLSNLFYPTEEDEPGKWSPPAGPSVILQNSQSAIQMKTINIEVDSLQKAKQFLIASGLGFVEGEDYLKLDLSANIGVDIILGDYKFVWATEAYLDKGYMKINTDSILFRTSFCNLYNLEFIPHLIYANSDNTIIDSLILYDDGLHWDSLANDGIYGRYIPPQQDENFYSLSVSTIDNQTNKYFSTPVDCKFTTAGPVIVDSLYAAFQPAQSRFAFRPYLRNLSTEAQILNPSVVITCYDSMVTNITQNKLYAPTILPEQRVSCGGTTSIYYDPSKVKDTLTFNIHFEIYSGGFVYWNMDTTVSFIITGVEEEQMFPSAYKLEQNYPNPFNPSTLIQYEIASRQFVTLKIYDLLGTEITTLVNEEKPVGTYELNWNAANLPSGVYFYRLQAGSFVETKKMILLK